jgi:hypothetical protein
MDTHGSYDRGTPALLRWEDLGPAPLLLNDDQMSQNYIPVCSSLDFNDMSFFALMFRAMVCQKKMMSMPDTADGWAARLQLVLTFEKSIQEDYFNISQDAPPFQRFTEHVAKEIIISMHLLLRRPPYKQRPGLAPSSDEFNVLEHSTRLLQQEFVTKSAEFAPWAWKSWVRWNALAIVLVELCSQPSGETYDAAYSIAVRSFNYYSSLIADTDAGMLWKPITKLMRRLQQLKYSDTTPEQVLDLASIDIGAPMASSTSGFSMPSPDWNFDGHDENPQDDQIMPMNDDAQINWLTFTDSMNMDYQIDWEHNLF